MAGLTTYAAEAILNHMLRNTAWPSPTTIYVALHTADPDDGTVDEVEGGSYARQAMEFSAPGTGGSYAVISNANDETFTNMPAVTVTHWSIWDAATAGNMLWNGELTSSKTIPAGEPAVFRAGSLSLSLS